MPDAIIDGEVVALDDSGAPNFAALQAALSEGRTDDLIFFVFDLLFEGGNDQRRLPLSERKARLKTLLEARKASGNYSLRRSSRWRGRCRPSVGVPHASGRHHLQALSAPYRSGRTESWTKSKCRAGHEVVIGGWSGGPTANSAR